MMAVATLNTTTSARFSFDAGGHSPASAMHVKKLSMARARQYKDISILLLFFSISNARPLGNCHNSCFVTDTESGLMHDINNIQLL